MLYITVEELESNLDYYLDLSDKEDIYIINKNKEVVAVLSSPYKARLAAVEELYNFIDPKKKPKKVDYDKLVLKAIKKKHGF